MNIRPLHDYILVKRKPRPTMTASGLLHIPEAHQETAKSAVVIAVGPGRCRSKDGRREPMHVRVGDEVAFNHMTRGTAVTGRWDDDETLFLVREDELVGIIEREEKAS